MMKFFVLTLMGSLLLYTAVTPAQDETVLAGAVYEEIDDEIVRDNILQEQVTYWVVGSFPERDQAITEGERISGAVGIEVLMLPVAVDGQSNFRLLVRVFTDVYDQARLKIQLGYAGVTDIRDTSITENEPGLLSLFAVLDFDGEVLGSTADFDDSITGVAQSRQPDPPDTGISEDPVPLNDSVSVLPANAAQHYLVAGSFREGRYARLLQARLEESFNNVLVKVTNINGVDYHRVLVGPVSEVSENEYRARARDAGIFNAWMLRGAAAQMAAIKEQVPNEIPVLPESDVPDSRSIQDTIKKIHTPADPPRQDALDVYNLARLRKTPGSFFLSPEK